MRSAASMSAASSAWSCVITSTWVPDGQLGKDQLGQHRDVVRVDPGDGVVEDGQHLGRQLLGPGVDQVQLQVVPGQDPGQLETDVPDPEDRDRGQHGKRLEQESHLAAAALDAVAHRRLVGEAGR